MNEQAEQRENELDGWPLPSRDVLRDLERQPLAWSEQDGEARSGVRPAA
jgi:hypothetical protein